MLAFGLMTAAVHAATRPTSRCTMGTPATCGTSAPITTCNVWTNDENFTCDCEDGMQPLPKSSIGNGPCR